MLFSLLKLGRKQAQLGKNFTFYDFDISIPDVGIACVLLCTFAQVTGYVLIMTNAIESLGLNNLRVIRGETLYESAGETDHPTGYSLYIALNYHVGNLPGGGLLELRLTSLRGA